MSGWQRIEGQCRSVSLAGGLEARVADPLWMLARQWQIGELRGDDAARPVGISVTARSLHLRAARAGGTGPSVALAAGEPIEFAVERQDEPTSGDAGRYAAARTGHRLWRMLANAGSRSVADRLAETYRLGGAPGVVATTGLPAATSALLGRLAIDGRRVLAEPDSLIAALAADAGGAASSEVLAVVARWRQWCASTGAAAGDGPNLQAWDPERLEYAFTVEAGRDDSLELAAAEHAGGAVDWFTFDATVAQGAAAARPMPTTPVPVPAQGTTITALPAAVRYRGQPAQRWWQFEDGSVNFADITAGPADLARLLVTEFAVAFAADWFVVPVRVATGTATEITQMTVVDNFGGRTRPGSTALHDGPNRVWRMFELSGDVVTQRHPSPWLVVPPTSRGTAGPPLETVVLARDEGANLVWAIERDVEGPAGMPVDRRLLASGRGRSPGAPVPAGPTGADGTADDVWAYRLESGDPPGYWVPFVAERVSAQSAETVLRRARMHQWNDAAAGPHGVLLDPTAPMWVREEEVPSSGVRVTRRWRYARGTDGAGRLWLQYEKVPAGGERSSGIRWDVIDVIRDSS